MLKNRLDEFWKPMKKRFDDLNVMLVDGENWLKFVEKKRKNGKSDFFVFVQKNRKDDNDDSEDEEKPEEPRGFVGPSPVVDTKHRYFVGKDYSNPYERDFEYLDRYSEGFSS